MFRRTARMKVESVDLKITENRIAHRTDKYEVSDLILRRGQEFTIDLKLSRPFKKSEDVIGVEFRTGKDSRTSDGTFAVATMVSKFNANQWGFKVASSSGNNVSLTVKSSASALVGEHQLDIVTHVTKDGAQRYQFRKGLKTTVYILFNPWCKDDNVYMDGDAENEEYVLNDFGNIWLGTSTSLVKRDWIFGQFDDEVFKCVLYLLKKHLPGKNRNDPVIVSRKMSAAVNFQDDGGVLKGRWDGKYKNGVKPTSWQGSVAILEKYVKTKKSVKYGQCWVFSGVMTTVLRCLGIPARSVTNFESGHDTDGNVIIDKCVDENNEVIPNLSSDSVWNFHVWNDCWMARPDLPDGFGGWQVVDATPQERSKGSYEERVAIGKAIRESDRTDTVAMSKDISYDIVKEDNLLLGGDLEIQVNLKNNVEVKRTVHLTTIIHVCEYRGVLGAKLKEEEQTHVLAAGQSKKTSVKVTVNEYLDKLVEQSHFKVFLLGKVEETNQLIADQAHFLLETPYLDVKVASSEQLKVGRPCKVSLSFKNPLSRTLTRCTFTTGGPGLSKPKIKAFRKVSPGEVVKHEMTLSPLNPGKRTIVAAFDCHQFEHVTGSLEVNITP